ncbi:MAG: histidine kinase dimerization/phospho-acceptor domain-containing protein [Alphaproteobacteria bacterium]
MASVVLEHDRRALALRSADERLSSLAANLPGVIYQRIVYPDGKIRYTYISEGARDLFGVAPAEIVANPDALFSRHGPKYATTFRENLLAASRELQMWDVEAQLITRDGQEKWTHARARPRRQPDGSVIWDGIILDSTRIKQANLALAAANRAKTEFLATMSHELRTPLNAIIGFSEIILKEAMGPIANEHYREYLVDILASGRHLLSLINDILDLSKVEAGRLEIDEGPINVIQSIDACTRLVKPRADDNKLTLAVQCQIEKPEFVGDERKFRQIITNLLSNAVEVHPEGGSIKVVIRNRRTAT